MARVSRYRRLIACITAAAACAAFFPLANLFTAHSGETVILLMSPALATVLWFGWPTVRRTAWWKYSLYIAALAVIVVGAQAIAVYAAAGRFLPIEVLWSVYFIVAWRLAWAVWSHTVGRIGERYRRWGRRTRREAGGLLRITDRSRRRRARLAMGVGPARAALTALVFAPLVFGSLIHRFKIGNQPPATAVPDLPIEEVAFTTQDGLRISGWFVADPDSDATVVICHGLGANKGNFASFLSLFHGQGYSALIFDFRGHGDSDGHTSTFGLFETADVAAAVNWLKAKRPDRARHVFGLGSSMGAMALVRAAAGDPRIEAVVLDSAFASASLVAHQHLQRVPVVGSIFADLALFSMSLHTGRSLWQVDARPAIARLAPRPVLLIHGQDDVVISPDNLDLLFTHAREPKQRWLGPGPHSNILTTDFDGYQRRVIRFFEQARRFRSRAPAGGV